MPLHLPRFRFRLLAIAAAAVAALSGCGDDVSELPDTGPHLTAVQAVSVTLRGDPLPCPYLQLGDAENTVQLVLTADESLVGHIFQVQIAITDGQAAFDNGSASQTVEFIDGQAEIVIDTTSTRSTSITLALTDINNDTLPFTTLQLPVSDTDICPTSP